jgi:single-strand DNA-binding protein
MLNKVILAGRLTADPELKYTPSGLPVVHFRIAVDRPFKNAQGEREADFIDVVAWRQRAEFVCKYFSKGKLIFVDGRLEVRNWETPEHERRRSVEVQAENVSFLEARRDSGGDSSQGAGPRPGGGGMRRDDEPPMPEPPPDTDVPDITDPFADQ